MAVFRTSPPSRWLRTAAGGMKPDKSLELGLSGGASLGQKLDLTIPGEKMRIHSSWFNLENMNLTSENKDGSLLPMKNGI